MRPFGLEPQRILRLQKMHILVGQDTDSESTPFGAAMPWIVKLDKEQDLIGKWALEHYAERRRRRRWSGSRCPTAMCPPRARSWSTIAARPPARSRAHATRRCWSGRSGWPGCRRRWLTTAPGSRSPTRAAGWRRDPDQAVLRSRGRGAALMSLDFLRAAPAPSRPTAPVARSPMERSAAHAGARFELRDGWNVAVGYDAGRHRAPGAPRHGGWADCSHLAQARAAGPARLSAIVAACRWCRLELGTAIAPAAPGGAR